MPSVEDVAQEDARAWELVQQQRADAELAAKAAQELADQARAQVRCLRRAVPCVRCSLTRTIYGVALSGYGGVR